MKRWRKPPPFAVRIINGVMMVLMIVVMVHSIFTVKFHLMAQAYLDTADFAGKSWAMLCSHDKDESGNMHREEKYRETLTSFLTTVSEKQGWVADWTTSRRIRVEYHQKVLDAFEKRLAQTKDWESKKSQNGAPPPSPPSQEMAGKHPHEP